MILFLTKDVFDLVKTELKTENGIACYRGSPLRSPDEQLIAVQLPDSTLS